ncbi:MAG: RNA helicase [Methanomicrobiaceae archaeon]|nr:RNA helicase [Methanomicrobiaceae archaeon]
MISQKARFKAAKKLQNILGYRVPEFAFKGQFLEAVCAVANYQRMDRRLRDQLNNFFKVFLNCKCKTNPLCGCPERKFAAEILELRMTGMNHRQISEFLLDEYGIYLFPADILSYLEESVHVLEAVKDVSVIENNENMIVLSAKAIADIER